MKKKVVVGIDLGTTNTAVATVTVGDDGLPGRVAVWDVPQLVAPAEIASRSQLPSFTYLAGEHDLPAAATALPWDPESRVVVGELARAQGARVPGRMIASAKSWLCHPGVDRSAAILPWGVEGGGPRLSPVDASAKVLAHVAAAWKHKTGMDLGGDGVDVVLTVPASFDEVARDLTLQAAVKAGLGHVTLLEEPQAVFYAWIDRHGGAARRAALAPGEVVLVCDVGGGTTDFTLIRVADDGDGFERTAVGDHLLLGGDNIDIALARLAEARLGQLDAIQWHGLVHACRMAKEAILGDDTLDARVVTVQARGSKLLGGAMKTEITRAEVEGLVLDGFLPLVDADARPARARVGLAEFGLPYAADAAITRHLAAFLARHGSPPIAAVLFNGGAMKPAKVRARILAQLAAWQGGAAPRELTGAEPDLAVARGAAYFGLVRLGVGSRIRGGAARAFYLGVAGGGAICLAPRGAEEGSEHTLAEDFLMLANRPASFRLYTSSGRADQPGDEVVPAEHEDIVLLPPLVTVLRASGRSEVRVRVRAKLTEVGTLEVWCEEKDGAARWRLTFDLRLGGARAAGRTTGGMEALAGPGGGEDPEAAEAPPEPPAAGTPEGQAMIAASFAGEPGAPPPASLLKELEKKLDARRDEWSTSTCRALWDGLLRSEPARGKSAESEARFLNLSGFLLRPGWGAPLDQWRVGETWRLWNLGLRWDRDEACRLAWWIHWRRVAAGMKRTQQEQIYDRLAALFLPGPKQKERWFKMKPSPQEVGEMWRLLGACERLTASARVKLGDAALGRIQDGKDKDDGALYFALGRLGGRAPLYGPLDAVVPAEAAVRWIEGLLTLPAWKQPEKIVFPAAQLGRRTGDRARDVPDEVRARLAARLRAEGAERAATLVEEIIELESREERVAFGDSLPSGLRKAEPS